MSSGSTSSCDDRVVRLPSSSRPRIAVAMIYSTVQIGGVAHHGTRHRCSYGTRASSRMSRGLRRSPSHPDRRPLRRRRPGNDAGRQAVRAPICSSCSGPTSAGACWKSAAASARCPSGWPAWPTSSLGIEPNPCVRGPGARCTCGRAEVLAARVPARRLRPGRAAVAPLRHRLLRQRARAHRRRRGRAAHVHATSMQPGGHVLIWVPAVPAAYGPLDAELGHHRRYTKASLAQAFAQARPGDRVAALHQPDRPDRLDVQRARRQVHDAQPGAGQAVRNARRPVGAAARPADSAAVGLSLVAVGRRAR